MPIGGGEPNHERDAPTVEPPPEKHFNGTAACGTISAYGESIPAWRAVAWLTPRELRRDPANQPHDAHANGHSDGTSNTILMAECAGGRHFGTRASWLRTNISAAAPGPSGFDVGQGSTRDGTAFFGPAPSIARTTGRSIAFIPDGATPYSRMPRAFPEGHH